MDIVKELKEVGEMLRTGGQTFDADQAKNLFGIATKELKAGNLGRAAYRIEGVLTLIKKDKEGARAAGYDNYDIDDLSRLLNDLNSATLFHEKATMTMRDLKKRF